VTSVSHISNGKTSASQKRSVATPDNSQLQPQTKKTKTANTDESCVQPKQPSQVAAASEPSSNGKATKGKVPVEATEGETNIAKSLDDTIPMDENCPLVGYMVYIDPNRLIYDASLNQTNASNNNNKFYRLQVCHLHHLWKLFSF
jgi:poly [ADP-ribose] polymerase